MRLFKYQNAKFFGYIETRALRSKRKIIRRYILLNLGLVNKLNEQIIGLELSNNGL